jgi:hypothetical protein
MIQKKYQTGTGEDWRRDSGDGGAACRGSGILAILRALRGRKHAGRSYIHLAYHGRRTMEDGRR